MRILLSAYACEPGRGSEPGFGWNWSTYLAQAGHDVWVLTYVRHREAIERHLQRAPVPNLHFAYIDVSGRAKPFLLGQPGVFLRYLIWQRAAYREAIKLEREQNFDIIHHITYGSLTGGSWLWRLQKPFVFGPVGGGQVAPRSFKAYFFKQWRQEAVRSFVTERILPWLPSLRKMLRRTSLVLATNTETLVLARRMGARQAELFLDSGLPAHYFTDVPALPLRGPEMRILWVGRLYARKALCLSLEALSKTTIPFRLTILGDGPLAAQVPGWIRAYGLEEKVDWKGHVSWDEVQHAYRNHDVLLFTSLRDSFGSQLLEAMANGVPLVTLCLHGAKDFVPDAAGVKVPVASPDETVASLARALDALYRDAERRLGMRTAGMAFARTMEWSNKAREMTRLYHRILQDVPVDVIA